MNYFSTSLIFVAGLSFAFGLLYLFIGLRRQEERPLNLIFALFALAYAGATLAAQSAYAATSVSQYLNAERIISFFAVAAFIFIIWYVAVYTDVKPRPVL